MASFQLIGAASGAQRDWLFSHVAESRNAGRSVVVFVPEQYTLQAERDLLSGLRLTGPSMPGRAGSTELCPAWTEPLRSCGRRG